MQPSNKQANNAFERTGGTSWTAAWRRGYGAPGCGRNSEAGRSTRSSVTTALDFARQTVRLGSVVRIRELSAVFLRSLPRLERRRVKSMIGDTFIVDEVDSAGLAWVTKTWDLGDGKHDAHGVGLSATEMELLSESTGALIFFVTAHPTAGTVKFTS